MIKKCILINEKCIFLDFSLKNLDFCTYLLLNERQPNFKLVSLAPPVEVGAGPERLTCAHPPGSLGLSGIRPIDVIYDQTLVYTHHLKGPIPPILVVHFTSLIKSL